MTVSPFLRQFVVALSTQLAAFSLGGTIAFPSLIIEQVKINGSSINLDVHTASWIGSIYGLAGIPAIVMPMIAQEFGRKCGYLLACSFLTAGWTIALFANSTALILTSESFHGLATNCVLPMAALSNTEMLAPKYRMIFMQILSFMMALGLTTVGILGRFCSLKTISWIMLAPTLVAIAIGLTWRESPPWLAWKGKFEKCEENFLWLRGKDDSSNKELTDLLMSQRENLSIVRNSGQSSWKTFKKNIASRDFYMPSFHIFMLMNLLYWSGGDVVLIYFISMVKRTTQDENAVFYSSIAMYSIILCGSMTTNFLVTRFKNKSVLLFSSCGVTLSLICAFIASALQSAGVLSKDSLVIMFILIAFTVFNSLGMNACVFIISSELMPVKHRSLGGTVYIISNCILYASTQKISPYLIEYLGMWGTFLIFALNGIFCGWFVWKCIPETKGRTLQEIEDFYVHGKFIKRRQSPLQDRSLEEL